MLERMHNSKVTCDELKSFYSSEFPSHLFALVQYNLVFLQVYHVSSSCYRR